VITSIANTAEYVFRATKAFLHNGADMLAFRSATLRLPSLHENQSQSPTFPRRATPTSWQAKRGRPMQMKEYWL
jgi:hypothetical protein